MYIERERERKKDRERVRKRERKRERERERTHTHTHICINLMDYAEEGIERERGRESEKATQRGCKL